MTGLSGLLENVVGTGTEEGQFLTALTLMEGAETLVNLLARNDNLPQELALRFCECKQGLIDAFAAYNRGATLASVQEVTASKKTE